MSLGSDQGSLKLLISPTANSGPPQLEGTPSPADTRKPAGAAELVGPPPPPPQPARLCTLLHPQEAAASLGETVAQGGEGWEYPVLGSSGWLHICTAGSPQPSVAVTEMCSGLGSDNVLKVEGEEKSRELEVLWIVKGVCAWAPRVQRGVGGICKS